MCHIIKSAIIKISAAFWSIKIKTVCFFLKWELIMLIGSNKALQLSYQPTNIVMWLPHNHQLTPCQMTPISQKYKYSIHTYKQKTLNQECRQKHMKIVMRFATKFSHFFPFFFICGRVKGETNIWIKLFWSNPKEIKHKNLSWNSKHKLTMLPDNNTWCILGVCQCTNYSVQRKIKLLKINTGSIMNPLIRTNINYHIRASRY